MLDIGGTLREARTRSGLELDDVAAATRIRKKYLAALEDERLGALPEDVYARAFLRTYADFLGLDGDLYAAELNARLEASRPPPPPPPPEPRFTVPRLDRRALAVAGAAGALLFVGLVAWRGGDSGMRVPPQSTVGVVAATKTIPSARRPPTQVASSAPSGRIVLAATRGDCWLSVRAGSREGRVLYEGMLQAGDEVRISGVRVWIRVGAPWNLVASVNGRALRGLPADTGNVVVTPGGLTPA
jgi:cytoskeleton protein RodZ